MGVRVYGSTGNLLTFVSLCDKSTGLVQVICGASYRPENTVIEAPKMLKINHSTSRLYNV